GKVHMAQFSMEIMRLTGSVLRGNQQVSAGRGATRTAIALNVHFWSFFALTAAGANRVLKLGAMN
ncbi:hypothetical protein ABVB70_26730, partial [Agrobacterium radiobacter]